MEYLVVLEQSESGWGAHVPDLPGCVAAGASREETLHLIREAVSFHLEGLRETGEPVPPPASVAETVAVGAA